MTPAETITQIERIHASIMSRSNENMSLDLAQFILSECPDSAMDAIIDDDYIYNSLPAETLGKIKFLSHATLTASKFQLVNIYNHPY